MLSSKNTRRVGSNLYSFYSTKEWTVIAKMLKQKFNIKKRSAKQCRERWHNHLDPNIRKDPISNDEERLIFEYHKVHGNKWAKIASELNGRTDNQIKNQFYSTLRRQLRKINNCMSSKRFMELTEQKYREMTLEDLYKFLKSRWN